MGKKVRKQIQEPIREMRVLEDNDNQALFLIQTRNKALEQTMPSYPLSSKVERMKAFERLRESWDCCAQIAQIAQNYKWKREDAYDDPRYR